VSGPRLGLYAGRYERLPAVREYDHVTGSTFEAGCSTRPRSSPV